MSGAAEPAGSRRSEAEEVPRCGYRALGRVCKEPLGHEGFHVLRASDAELAAAEQDRALANVQAAAWGALALLADGRPAQAEGLLRSCLPPDYQPHGAPGSSAGDPPLSAA